MSVRQAGDETEQGESDIIRKEITDAMVMAGIRALGQWQRRKDAGEAVTQRDLLCAVYSAMRLQA